MEAKQFSIDEIQIGDEILFDGVEHNLLWRVINKISNNRLIVEIKEMGYAGRFTIAVKDVIMLETNTLAI
ncbi:hypothetical protein BH11BAC3_BH11BAC3_07330 [soil metagenome]